ncbi:hypothetical protein NQ318_001753 [Aromia moschata]|uniref:Uncharacterized protein n=1 Tax=Aromia moschata TaxID=1265417 RepID=A0AAV8XTF9_9CUCU|nr:hypothetical protein NQ318_001753 [Aromia moschata]
MGPSEKGSPCRRDAGGPRGEGGKWRVPVLCQAVAACRADLCNWAIFPRLTRRKVYVYRLWIEPGAHPQNPNTCRAYALAVRPAVFYLAKITHKLAEVCVVFYAKNT